MLHRAVQVERQPGGLRPKVPVQSDGREAFVGILVEQAIS